MTSYSRRVLTSVLALTIVFVSWAFSGPLGAGPRLDPDHHISSIWCGWGESPGICQNLGPGGNFGYKAEVPFMFQFCEGRPIDYWHKCEAVESSEKLQELRTADPSSRNLYYKLMRVFASENATQSVLMIRIFNGVLAALCFGSLFFISSIRSRKSAVISWLLVLVPVAIETFISVNPRSWSYIGVLTGWVYFNEVLKSYFAREKQSWFHVAMLLVSAFLCAASRWDAVYFFVISLLVVYLSKMVPQLRRLESRTIAWGVAFLVIILTIVNVGGFSNRVFSFSLPTAVPSPQFFSYYIVNLPSFLGEIWKQPPQYAGGTSFSIQILCIGLVIAWAAHICAKFPRIMLFVPLSLLAIACLSIIRAGMIWQALLGVQGEYVLAFMGTFIGITSLVSKNVEDYLRSNANKRIFISIISIAHFLSLYNYLEFYVRRGENIGGFAHILLNDGWWWNSGIGPNWVLICGSLSFVVFISTTLQLIDTNRSVTAS